MEERLNEAAKQAKVNPYVEPITTAAVIIVPLILHWILRAWLTTRH